jgi:hypothetical protein
LTQELTFAQTDLLLQLIVYLLVLTHLIEPGNIIPEKIKYHPRGNIKHYLNNEKSNINNRHSFKLEKMYMLPFQKV